MPQNFYSSKEKVSSYIKSAKDVNSAELIEKLKKYLPKDSSLLELGSGPGTDWRLLNEYFQVTGSDFSEEFLKHLKKENPDGEFLQIDAHNIQTAKKFDGIYSNKVLHHLTDEQLKKSIESQLNILNTHGVICHSFWKGEGNEDFNGMFVNYHAEKGLRKKFNHFEILLFEEYKEFEDNDSLVLIAKKK